MYKKHCKFCLSPIPYPTHDKSMQSVQRKSDKNTSDREELMIESFITDLRILQANIPLTFGRYARDMAKEMIKKWEKIK